MDYRKIDFWIQEKRIWVAEYRHLSFEYWILYSGIPIWVSENWLSTSKYWSWVSENRPLLMENWNWYLENLIWFPEFWTWIAEKWPSVFEYSAWVTENCAWASESRPENGIVLVDNTEGFCPLVRLRKLRYRNSSNQNFSLKRQRFET